MRCRCCTDAASQHEQIQGTAVWRVGWVHAHTSSGGGGHSGTSSFHRAFLRYRAAWDNKHVCVCVLRDILNIILNTGNCTSVLIRCSITRGPWPVRPSVLKTRTAGRSGPRSPRRRPVRAGRGRDQSDGPSGRSGAVRAFFHVSANFTRSQLCASGSAVWTVRLRSLHFFKNADYLVTIGSRMRGVHARCLMIPADGDLSDCDQPLQKRALLTNEAVLRV